MLLTPFTFVGGQHQHILNYSNPVYRYFSVRLVYQEESQVHNVRELFLYLGLNCLDLPSDLLQLLKILFLSLFHFFTNF